MSARADMQEKKEKTEKIILRLKQVCSAKTDTELAQILGISANNIFGWRRRKNVPDREIFAVSEKFHVRSRWLAFGELPMYEEEARNTDSEKNGNGTQNFNVKQQTVVHDKDIELTEEEKKMIEVLEMFGITTAEELEIALKGVEEANELRQQGIDVVITEFADYLSSKKKNEMK